MKRSTLLHSVLALISLNLLWMSAPALAQHGGGHGGGGGGGHAAGGGGGFHGGGSYSGVHGGGYSGGYSGGYRGGGTGAYAGRGSSGGAGLGERSSNAGHPWSWEGHSSRDASPGWHGFAAGNGTGTGRSAGGSTAARSGESPIARAGSLTTHAAVADGNWHSFNRATTGTASERVASVNHSTFISNGFGWRGGWRSGFALGFGWPGWNWGWGCCGWGWGFGFGWGWGWWGPGWWGPGWAAWSPFWAWPPYYYTPWLDDSWMSADTPPPAPYVVYPYPA